MKHPRRHLPQLALNLRRERHRASLSQYELADRSAIARATIANIETGKQQTALLSTLESLANALGIAVGDLVMIEGGAATAKQMIDSFEDSAWGSAAQATPEEMTWLRSLPDIAWLGKKPTDKTFFLLIEALRETRRSA